MNYQSAIQYLNSLTNFEQRLHQLGSKDFSLENFRIFLQRLGDPQDQLKCIHIAGSKGKGSTAACTAEILKEAGYRVGLYTSPHFYDVRERIRMLSSKNQRQKNGLFGDEISEDDFARLTGDLKEVVERGFDKDLLPFGLQDDLSSKDARMAYREITYFEFLTAVAFLYFYSQKADVVVLETGLGGRLDATNVVRSLACGITLIDLEHTHILGNDICQIAEEKAGIIKSGCLGVVSGVQQKAVRDIIRQQSRACHLDVSFVGSEIGIEEEDRQEGGLSFRVLTPHNAYDCQAPFLGEFQAVNAAVAIGLVESVGLAGFIVEKEHIEKAIAHVFWPGRMEVVSENPMVILDGAHTPESSRIVSETMHQLFPDKGIVLILGMSSDKNKYAIAENFSGHVKRVVFTKSLHGRADALAESGLAAVFQKKGVEVFRTSSVAEAIADALVKMSHDEILLVAGSLFLVAEARKIFLDKKKGDRNAI